MRAGQVALELDGRPWRTVPEEVVLRVGLAAGDELDRPTLRRLRVELRRARALATGAQTLARRELSRTAVAERLRQAGATAGERDEALGALERAGLVDDARASASRARALAERGWGDAAIQDRLESEGFEDESARSALAALPRESERATAFAGRRSDRRRSAAALARRGFSLESIDDALGTLDEEP